MVGTVCAFAGHYLPDCTMPAPGEIPHHLHPAQPLVFAHCSMRDLLRTPAVVRAVFTAALTFLPVAEAAEPLINEFVADNVSGLMDEDGVPSDWIEIYNPGPTVVDLTGWKLTDEVDQAPSWTFPSMSLAPGAYRVVFASGKDRRNPAANLHTNFSLSKGGEYLALVRPDDSVAEEFSPAYPAQDPNRSYGLSNGAFYFFNTPTPGAANGPPSSLGKVEDTVFSVTRGFFNAPISVAITTATPGATIRYTRDGSRPTATTGLVYSGPIAINSTTILRAAAFKPGYDATNVDTQTYLYLDSVIRQSANGTPPTGWPGGSPNGQVMDYAMDSRVVDHVDPSAGGVNQVKASLLALPTVSVALKQSDLTGTTDGIYVNADSRGIDWERQGSIELINDPLNKGGGFQSECGVRIRGNFSRTGSNPKHSFRIFFRGEYGDSALHYRLFGYSGTDKFDSFDIQSPQDFSWAFYEPQRCNYIRDPWSRATLGDLGQPTARSRWAHLYLNGVYWGIFQIEERPEAAYAESYLGGDKSEYDVIKSTGLDGGYSVEATDGYLTGPGTQTSAWQDLFNKARSHSAAPNETKYFALQGLASDGVTPIAAPRLIEPVNLTDYFLMVIHSANTDMLSSVWVGNRPNNFFSMRRRNGSRGFITVAHDGETSLDYYSNTYDRTGPVNNTALRSDFTASNMEFFHDDLMPSLEYRTLFGDRAHRALFNRGALTPEKCVERVDRIAQEIDRGIIAESARWGDAQRASQPYTRLDWISVKDQTRAWFAGRREALLTQLRADGLYPNVNAPTFSQHGGELPLVHAITMSGGGGPIYYTTDGSDPRRIGGTLNPAALSYTSGTSNPVTFIPSGATWKYRDRGTNEGTVWRNLGFDDAGWSSGPAQLGYGEGNEATRIEDNATPGYNAADVDRYLTTYFRHRFNVSNATGVTSLTLELLRDDGAAVYLNGQEIEPARSNLPSGDIAFDTPASASATGAEETTFYSFDVDPRMLVEGENVIAAEVHQSSRDSSDVSFDLRLTATQTVGAQQLTLPPGIKKLNARARTATGAWSALVSAEFLVGGERASATNLGVSEIMYHPSNEEAEFLELTNFGSKSIDLRGARFVEGVQFVFPETQPLLAPGQRVLLARNKTVFESVYGTGRPIAGEYGGNLDNAGESLLLLAADDSILLQFTYDDAAPWPSNTDGTGLSLVLRKPGPNIDLSSPQSWRSSLAPGGTPGGSDAIGYLSWKQSNGVLNDSVDSDGDGLLPAVEYLFGTSPNSPNTLPFEVALESSGGGQPPIFLVTLRTATAADDASFRFDFSSDLTNWTPVEGELVSHTPLAGGVSSRTYRILGVAGQPSQFIRARITVAP